MPEQDYSVRSTSGRGQQGTVRQQPNGRWIARYLEDGRGGRRPQKTFPTRAAAAEWLRERIAGLDQARTGDTRQVVLAREGGLTVDEALDRYLAAHDVDPVTLRKLAAQLRPARAEFGGRLFATVEPYELQAWRKTLSPGWRHDVFRAFRQAGRQVHAWHWIPDDPFAEIKNPRPRRAEVRIPSRAAVLAVADEIDERYAPLVVFAAGTGLRPEEWIALDRADLDLRGRLVRVRRIHSQGRTVELGADGTKSHRQRRDVPLRGLVVEALQELTPRIDTRRLFPAPLGGQLDLERFRSRFWVPAVQASGVDPFPPKDLRHVYASESLAAGISLFQLSRRMGTSLKQIDDTYGHLVADADEHERRLLDAYDTQVAEAGR